MKKTSHQTEFSGLVIFYKLALGLIELISGLGIALFGKIIMADMMFQLTQELSEDPHDLIAHLSVNLMPHIFNHNTYFILTLIILGVAKIAGAIGLIYKQNWGVDLLVGLTLIMLPFQLVNLIRHHSLFDLFYISLGVVIALYLIRFGPKAWISRIFQPNSK